MKLNDIPLARKLWSSIIVLLLLMAATGVYTRHAVSQAHREAAERTRAADKLIQLTTYWKALSGNNTNLMLVSTVSTEPAVTKRFGERLNAAIDLSGATHKQIEELAVTHADKAAIARIGEKRSVLLSYVKRLTEMKAAGQGAQIETILEKEYLPAIARYEEAQEALIALQRSQRAEVAKEAEARIKRVVLSGVAITVVVLLVGVLWAHVLVRSINQPLNRAVALAEAIAAGDLTQEVQETRRDELGRLVRGVARMSQQLRIVVSEVREGVGSVSAASSEIAMGNQDLSSRTEQTASNLQETASSLEQLSGAVAQAADVAQQASQLAVSAADSAARGGEVVGDVVSSMEKISDASRRISDIIGVIDGIAFQTNILALNAAVEAARAGEQGRGFAVVASEVRSLAQRSAEAAKEIKSLIGRSVDSVAVGTRQVEQARHVMGEIVTSVRHVSNLIGEVAASASEQRDGINQVHQAVDNIDQMTQQNSSLVEESTAAAASLSDQARRLTQTVEVFKVLSQAAASAQQA